MSRKLLFFGKKKGGGEDVKALLEHSSEPDSAAGDSTVSPPPADVLLTENVMVQSGNELKAVEKNNKCPWYKRLFSCFSKDSDVKSLSTGSYSDDNDNKIAHYQNVGADDGQHSLSGETDVLADLAERNSVTTLLTAAEEMEESEEEEKDDRKIADEGLTPLRRLGYHFDNKGRLVDKVSLLCRGRLFQEGVPFTFTTQAAYEELGEAMTDEVYALMEQRGLRRLYLRNMDDTGPDSEFSFVYVSDGFETKDTLLVLIHGSGAVRAGQWARQLIINENLETGSQLPYIDRALANGWGVLVTNTNYNGYQDEFGYIHRFPYSENAEKHGLAVWHGTVQRLSDHFALKRIFVVAHSAGGSVISHVVDQFPTSPIRIVALTDSWYSASKKPRPFVVNWDATLDRPLERLEHYWRLSSGTRQHVRTSAAAFQSIFKMLEADPDTDEQLVALLSLQPSTYSTEEASSPELETESHETAHSGERDGDEHTALP